MPVKRNNHYSLLIEANTLSVTVTVSLHNPLHLGVQASTGSLVWRYVRLCVSVSDDKGLKHYTKH